MHDPSSALQSNIQHSWLETPPEADFDFNWLWHSDPANHTIMKQHSVKVDSALLMVARDYGNMSWSPINAQLKQNSSKKCAGVGFLLAVHIGLGSLRLWLCIATNDLPAALTVTDDCDATAVWKWFNWLARHLAKLQPSHFLKVFLLSTSKQNRFSLWTLMCCYHFEKASWLMANGKAGG